MLYFAGMYVIFEHLVRIDIFSRIFQGEPFTCTYLIHIYNKRTVTFPYSSDLGSITVSAFTAILISSFANVYFI